jgi:hypothetical protein
MGAILSLWGGEVRGAYRNSATFVLGFSRGAGAQVLTPQQRATILDRTIQIFGH